MDLQQVLASGVDDGDGRVLAMSEDAESQAEWERTEESEVLVTWGVKSTHRACRTVQLSTSTATGHSRSDRADYRIGKDVKERVEGALSPPPAQTLTTRTKSPS